MGGSTTRFFTVRPFMTASENKPAISLPFFLLIALKVSSIQS
jgi:hypothetical protein